MSDKVYVTPNGKTIAIRRQEQDGLLEIYFTSGGELPEILKGSFTSTHEAEKLINLYLAGRVSDGKRQGRPRV